MSHKSPRIASMIEHLRGRELSPYYLGFFECFNQQLFYEAHDVLEELWLQERKQTNDLFYKGLIQLAGAFVHLQKNRLKPAASLFRLAEGNLSRFPAVHQSLDLSAVLGLIAKWLTFLEQAEFEINPLQRLAAPRMEPFPAVKSGNSNAGA